MKQGKLFVISAPSGAGKSTLVNRIRQLCSEISYSISCTTRKPRGNEMDGKEYHFLTQRKFEEMIRDNEFLEYKEVHGHLYGTPAKPIRETLAKGRAIILDIDVMGAKEIFRTVPSAVGIFIVAPNQHELEKRLRLRGTDSEHSIRTRMMNATREVEIGSTFQYQIINDDLNHAVEELLSIIQKESEICRS